MSRRFCSWTNPGQYKTRKKINFVYKKISIIFVHHLNQKKKIMNTIIEIIKSQNTFLESSIVVFWLFCVISFYSTLVYGVGYVVYERVVKK